MKTSNEKRKVAGGILTILVVCGFSFLVYGFSLFSNKVALPPELSNDFIGSYQSDYYNITLVVFSDEPNAFYYSGQEAFRGTLSKESDSQYRLSGKYGEELVDFQGKELTFHEGHLKFKKALEGPMITPEIRKLRKEQGFKEEL